MKECLQPAYLASLRALAINRVRLRLQRDSFPRTHMALIVGLTGGAGLLASFSLLQLELTSMALRYPLALALAYLFFLFLIGLWLRTNAGDYLDALNFPTSSSGRVTSPEGLTGIRSGGGGDFGGGGASGSIDSPPAAFLADDEAPLNSAGEAVGTVAEADELAIPLLALALAVGLALASVWVIYIAPGLLAEVLVDGGLSYALYRHLYGQEPAHWAISTLRRTLLPFVATAVFLAAVGAAMSHFAPGARSIGEVLASVSQSKIKP